MRSVDNRIKVELNAYGSMRNSTADESAELSPWLNYFPQT